MYHLNYEWVLLVVLVTLLGTIIMTLVVVVTTDVKALVAYSSVAHISLCVLGVVLDLSVVLTGASISSLAHSYISALMFYVVGEIYHINGTRILPYISGFSHVSNSVVFMVSLNLLANGSVPPAVLFFGELVVLSVSFNMLFFLFVVISVYFIFSLYYSISLMVVFIKSGGSISLVPLALLSTSLPYVFIVMLVSVPIFID